MDLLSKFLLIVSPFPILVGLLKSTRYVDGALDGLIENRPGYILLSVAVLLAALCVQNLRGRMRGRTTD